MMVPAKQMHFRYFKDVGEYREEYGLLNNVSPLPPAVLSQTIHPRTDLLEQGHVRAGSQDGQNAKIPKQQGRFVSFFNKNSF